MNSSLKEIIHSTWIRRMLRWVVPIAVIVLIIRTIDFTQLTENISKVNHNLFIVGILLAPVLIILAIVRWQILLSRYTTDHIPFPLVLKHYWTGLTLGFFSPGSLGLDAYRVIAFRYQRGGGYINNIFIIIVEKVLALATCLAIIVALYPALPLRLTGELAPILKLANILLLFLCLGIIIVFLFTHHKIFAHLFCKLDRYYLFAYRRIGTRLGISREDLSHHRSLISLLTPLKSPKMLLIVLLSFGIQFVSALKSQIFFCSLGYDLPFIVNLFAAPTLYFIFMLPISLGSIGIREGIYILLFGLFGVPAEIALLVSFFNLFGIVINNLIGGIIMLIAHPEFMVQ